MKKKQMEEHKLEIAQMSVFTSHWDAADLKDMKTALSSFWEEEKWKLNKGFKRTDVFGSITKSLMSHRHTFNVCINVKEIKCH